MREERIMEEKDAIEAKYLDVLALLLKYQFLAPEHFKAAQKQIAPDKNGAGICFDNDEIEDNDNKEDTYERDDDFYGDSHEDLYGHAPRRALDWLITQQLTDAATVEQAQQRVLSGLCNEQGEEVDLLEQIDVLFTLRSLDYQAFNARIHALKSKIDQQGLQHASVQNIRDIVKLLKLEPLREGQNKEDIRQDMLVILQHFGFINAALFPTGQRLIAKSTCRFKDQSLRLMLDWLVQQNITNSQTIENAIQNLTQPLKNAEGDKLENVSSQQVLATLASIDPPLFQTRIAQLKEKAPTPSILFRLLDGIKRIVILAIAAYFLYRVIRL